jgi:hypothetical protein
MVWILINTRDIQEITVPPSSGDCLKKDEMVEKKKR